MDSPVAGGRVVAGRPAVSVIVPVYNVERYLRQCLDSLAAQTLPGLEVIVVDDGATDGCPRICDEYAARHPRRFQVLHQANAGVGRAYNAGMELARGQYIGFLESDDWAAPEAYATLHALAAPENLDVVKAQFWEFGGGREKVARRFGPEVCGRVVTERTQVPELLYGPGALGHWSAIYRADFLRARRIRYNETPGASGQDIGFSARVWLHMESFLALDRPLVHYRRDNPCASMRGGTRTAFAFFDEIALTLDDLEERGEVAPALWPYLVCMQFRVGLHNYFARCAGWRKQREYLTRFSAAGRRALEKGRYREDLFTPWERRVFLSIANAPERFFWFNRLSPLRRIESPWLWRAQLFGATFHRVQRLHGGGAAVRTLWGLIGWKKQD